MLRQLSPTDKNAKYNQAIALTKYMELEKDSKMHATHFNEAQIRFEEILNSGHLKCASFVDVTTVL